MRLTTTKRLQEQVAFKTTRDAIRAIERNHLKSEVREITDSMSYAALLKWLAALRRPFGIVIVTAKGE
jgi:RNase P protein component